MENLTFYDKKIVENFGDLFKPMAILFSNLDQCKSERTFSKIRLYSKTKGNFFLILLIKRQLNPVF